MRAGSTVRPQGWKDVIDLFDDKDFSAVWGKFENASSRCLGIRWNGNPDITAHVGFPNSNGHPLWFVVPEYLRKMILFVLCDRVNHDSSIGNIQNILVALNEYP